MGHQCGVPKEKPPKACALRGFLREYAKQTTPDTLSLLFSRAGVKTSPRIVKKSKSALVGRGLSRKPTINPGNAAHLHPGP